MMRSITFHEFISYSLALLLFRWGPQLQLFPIKSIALTAVNTLLLWITSMTVSLPDMEEESLHYTFLYNFHSILVFLLISRKKYICNEIFPICFDLFV